MQMLKSSVVKMKSIIALLLVMVAIVSGYYATTEPKFADKDMLVRQKQIFELFHHVYQRDFHDEYFKVAAAFNFADHWEDFNHPEKVKEFWTHYEHGFVPFEEIFSISLPTHYAQAVYLFNAMFYAKTYDTFFQVATWARYHVNTDLFIYSFTTAFFHRTDTVGLVLPAIYELNPYYFFTSDIIQKAQQYKLRGVHSHNFEMVDGVYKTYIHSNYSQWFSKYDHEYQMSYFTEDIGFNSYWYYFNLDYPFWMGGDNYSKLYKDRRGEFYLFQIQQILARYYLERLSNNLGEIDSISFHDTIYDGYFPNLRYPNGVVFPYRQDDYNIHHDVELIHYFEDFERRIRDAVELGAYYAPNGTLVHFSEEHFVEHFGNMFQANEDSPNNHFYGFWEQNGYKLLFSPSFLFDSSNVIPNTLQHYETAVRDPVFYQFYKRFFNSYWLWRNQLDSYTTDDLFFKGVEIKDVYVDKLITFFDFFNADITNAVDQQTDIPVTKSKRHVHFEGEDYVIYGSSKRLNHLPFTTKLTVTSDVAQKVVVKYFIGPKYDEFGNIYKIEDNEENWYELENFVADLVPGENVLTRKSTEFSWWVNDRTTYYDLYKQVLLSIGGTAKFPLDMSEAHCGFPRRLMLPKGSKAGMTYQMFFFVYPYHAPAVELYSGFDHNLSCGVGSGARYIDDKPFGFPFDRPVDALYWNQHNMYFYDATIYFKE